MTGTETPSLTQQLIGDVAPKLAEMTDEVLFGDIWERPGLSKRDRSVITVSILAAQYRIQQLPFHIGYALDNGVTREELTELITHATLYSGWPAGMSAIQIAKKVFEERGI
ncbi:MAG: carboxymuconolactone decarboxylase family protein [Sphingobium sp.]